MTKQPNFTYKSEPDSGVIELYVDGELITTWSVDDDPEICFDEFKNIFMEGINYPIKSA